MWPDFKEMTDEQLTMIAGLSESRILKVSKDDLRQSEDILLWSEALEKEIVDYWTELNKWWSDRKLPPCTCADHEGGFLAREAYNDYYYNDSPCSLDWFKIQVEKGTVKL